MLGTIVELGKAYSEDPLKILVDKTNAKDVFVIKFDISNGIEYNGIGVEENKGEEYYLYKREKGGLPGKLITGRIGSMDITNLRQNLTKTGERSQEEIVKFQKKKITWVKKSGILKNEVALQTIPPESSKLLKDIVTAIVQNQDQIMKDFCDIIKNGQFKEILLTVKLARNDEFLYLKDIPGFSELLRIAAQGADTIANASSNLKCTICNRTAESMKFKEPLPFWTIDKPTFIPDGKDENASKVLPLCKQCYLDMQNGCKYLGRNMNFDIPNSSGRTRLKFWIVPQLNSPELAREYIKGYESANLGSFKKIRELCRDMITTQQIDFEQSDHDLTYVSSFLAYTILFYTEDKQKHMRLVGSVDGVYPSRLEEISNTKWQVDKLSLKINQRFYFGLLIDFLEEDSNGWMKLMTHIMSCIFTGKLLDERFIYNLFLNRIKNHLVKRELKEMQEIVLKALITLEYFSRVGVIMSNKIEFESYKVEDKNTAEAISFLDTHSKILFTKNRRAICSIGMAVGIVIQVQKRVLNSDAFVSRLNRLEMDYARLYSLYPQTLMKLKHYKVSDYDELFAYLGSNEISNLDQTENIPQELMNLVFAIGMAEGFMIAKSGGSKE